MSTLRRIAKNTFILLVAQGISYIIAFFYTVLTARYLGPDGYGIIATAIAIIGIYAVMTDFGTHQLMTREVSRDNDKARVYLVNISLIKLVLIVCIYGLMALIVNTMGYPQQTIIVIYLLGLSVVFSTFCSMFYCIFQAYERMEFQAFGLVINTVVMLVGVFIAVNMKVEIVGFALIYIISALVSLIYCLCVLFIVFPKKFPDIKSRLFKYDTQGIKDIVRQCWPIGVMAILVVIRLKVDTIMLSVFGGDKAVGLYNSAYRFVDISSVVPAMIVSALFPTLAYLYSASPGRFDTASSRALKLLLFLALPLVFVVIMFAGPLISLTFGADYGSAVVTLQILICATGVMFLSTLTGTLFITADKQSTSMILAAGALLLNVVLNIILIPMYSHIGAAVTAFATEVLGLVASIVILTKMGHKFTILASIRAPLIAVVSIVIIVWLAHMINLNRIVVAIIALAVYGVVIYRFGIDKEDIALFKELYSAGNMDKGKIV